MTAVSVHHTETSEASWDGPANEARARSGEDAAYYRRIYAWQDSDGDPEAKSSWRFIHHEVDGDGNPGAANIRACQTGIGVLNGGRGGTTIPAADRQGVYNHLAAHLRDADVEPPELRSGGGASTGGWPEFRAPRDGETRYMPGELRADGAGVIEGYAATFNQTSEVLGWFVERIRPGAFAKTLREADVRALFNHNPDYVLGRRRAGTLELEEDGYGLRFRVVPPDTSWARDLRQSIERGDINQASFAFDAIRDEWNYDVEPNERELVEVRLYDVSIVTYPAYPQTSVSARALAHRFINEVRSHADPDAIDYLRAQLAELGAASPVTAAPLQEGHPAGEGAGAERQDDVQSLATAARQNELRRLRLELMKLKGDNHE